MVYVTGSISTKTGFAPVNEIAETVAIKVCETVITSSPGPISEARSASSRADIPESTPTAYLAPQYWANTSSKTPTSLPRIKSVLSSTPRMASEISFEMPAYCAFRSKKGTFICNVLALESETQIDQWPKNAPP